MIHLGIVDSILNQYVKNLLYCLRSELDCYTMYLWSEYEVLRQWEGFCTTQDVESPSIRLILVVVVKEFFIC